MTRTRMSPEIVARSNLCGMARGTETASCYKRLLATVLCCSNSCLPLVCIDVEGQAKWEADECVGG